VRQGGSNIEVETSLNLGENGIGAGDILSRSGNYKASGDNFDFYFGDYQRLSFRYRSSESHVGKSLQIIDKKEHDDWNYFSKATSQTNA